MFRKHAEETGGTCRIMRHTVGSSVHSAGSRTPLARLPKPTDKKLCIAYTWGLKILHFYFLIIFCTWALLSFVDPWASGWKNL